MIRSARRIAAAATLVAAGGCGHNGSSPARALVADVPCTAHVVSQDLSRWKEVAADGFTFCVPREWRVENGAGTGLEGRLTWGTGVPRRAEVGTEITVLDTVQRSLPISENRRFSEDIDGHSANLWRNRVDYTYQMGARWDNPRVWIVGVARSLIAADIELTIFRTVRFPS